MSSSAFYETESTCLARIAAGMGVPPVQVEEVVQEAWLDAVKHRHQFPADAGEGHLRSWLRRVVHSKAVDAIRRLGRLRCESLDAQGGEPIDGAGTKCTKVTEQTEWVAVLLEKVRVENVESHRLLCEHYLRERSIKELAREASTTEDAVDCRIRRLLRKLRHLAECDALGHEPAP